MPPGKRKRATRSTPLNLTIFATGLKADHTRPLLLDFPAELRNLIYEAVRASTGGVLLSRNHHKRALGVNSAILYTNKQVRDEASAVALLRADTHNHKLGLRFPPHRDLPQPPPGRHAARPPLSHPSVAAHGDDRAAYAVPLRLRMADLAPPLGQSGDGAGQAGGAGPVVVPGRGNHGVEKVGPGSGDDGAGKGAGGV
ncbi:hypothetical protein LTR53_007971 [Teratosphaeriaceae sp. CCFEE 6253]|nr:hypothetical protein LTR53_007971 [Teratosphaeriaceae sp. CCFEE 6253]